MPTAVTLQPAYVLHSRAYRNSSLIVDFFTLDHGRIRAVARAARGLRSRYRQPLQAFTPLLISARGRGDMLTLQAAEQGALALVLRGTRLLSGMYVNELLMRLLPLHESAGALFVAYRSVLVGLQGDAEIEPLLREFELALLEALGYGIDLWQEHGSGQAIEPDSNYLFNPASGLQFVPASRERPAAAIIIQGRDIIAMRERQWQAATTRRAAKRLLRSAIESQLDGRPLLSRRLFQSPTAGT